ncbi:MAG: hypothetical protein ACWGNB_05620, partial [Thiogranum sp.]
LLNELPYPNKNPEIQIAPGRQHVGEKHFQELALLIEAAINSALLEENANYVAELEQILQRMKRSGERFEDSAQIVNR